MKWNRPSPSLPSELGSEAPPTFGLSPERCSESLPEEKNDMDNNIVVEELTDRLPTSELVKIIKGALECGKRNMPFTESDLLRAMTFGASSTYVRVQRDSAQREPPQRDSASSRR